MRQSFIGESRMALLKSQIEKLLNSYGYDKMLKKRGIIEGSFLTVRLWADYVAVGIFKGDYDTWWNCELKFKYIGYKLSKEFPIYMDGRIQGDSFIYWQNNILRVVKKIF